MRSRLTRSHPYYPGLLAAIHDPPPQLWIRGEADVGLLSRTAVGVVGARACSSYGRTVARSLARDLAAAGVIVVSGMARGVDGEAHRGALEGGGATVAVLGCGIDRDYPAAHAELARRICETGLIVSEYEPGVEPAPWRFPARNRIISGLSRAIVVVEARERSGALITVDFALEQGRDVLVVPGEVTSALSPGSNALLRLGAAPALSVDDVLEADRHRRSRSRRGASRTATRDACSPCFATHPRRPTRSRGRSGCPPPTWRRCSPRWSWTGWSSQERARIGLRSLR